MAENETLKEIRSLKSDITSMGTAVGELKEMISELISTVKSDHSKLERLAATSKQDHNMLKSLEDTRRTLEVTGRIQVARSPVGL